MKEIEKMVLGLDVGVASIGWALIMYKKDGTTEIIKLGVRVNPLTVDEKTNFEKGRPLTTNADRTQKRSARRNLQRFKLRRQNLRDILLENKWITTKTPLTEIGKGTTHVTLQLRAKAAKEKVDLEDLARIFFAINKKRGYKSSRKVHNEEDGQAIDGMAIAKELYENKQTPGQYVYNSLTEGKKFVPDFYQSDLQEEFDLVWKYQQQFYPNILDANLYQGLKNQGQQNSRKRFLAIKGIYTAENKGKRDQTKLQHYTWRAKAIKEQLKIEEVAYVLVEINNNLNKSSGYLGAISDRSKELYFNKLTVGEYLWNQIVKNQHISLRNQVFYRQDYLDEFETIWQTQAAFYPQLTSKLKEEIRDVIIFYQRKLKSQKGALDFCSFESWQETYIDKETKKEKTRRVGRKVISKSSPLFQEFKIWQQLNNIQFIQKDTEEICHLEEANRKLLFEELNIRGALKETQILKIIGLSSKEWKTNFPEGLEGNRTNKSLYNAYQKIAENEGYGNDWAKKSSKEIKEELTAVFSDIGITSEILNFNANEAGENFDKQPAYALWHLLYATEDDEKITAEDKLIYGNTSVILKKKLVEKFGFTPPYAKLLATVSLQQEYGNVSSKAIRKMIPYLQAGHQYSKKDNEGIGIGACELAGYNASKSETREDKENKEYAKELKLLRKNELRNPVVEKILNQLVNVTNVVTEAYVYPYLKTQNIEPENYKDYYEVRIELARELKKNAKQRELMTKSIAEATRRNEDIRNTIRKNFGIPNPTKSDVVRYRLWQELAVNGYKEVFTGKKIDDKDIFSKNIEIEHIIPKTVVFDDSFSNKTLAFSTINKQKSNRTAIDFITQDFNADVANYKARVEGLYNKGKGVFSKAKRNKLLLTQKELPDGFIHRDLQNTQYIAKKAKELLSTMFKEVIVTSGSITDKLREDWGLINMMKELNFSKYKALGLTEFEERLNKGTGELKKVAVIKDWTKRNDHRHHAMDALTVAYTTRNHIQYLNFLNARKDETHKRYNSIISIEKKLLKKGVFIAPMPNFRTEAKKEIEAILISIKNKNKVVTKNGNIYKTATRENRKIQDTPRGQLHKETIYGTAKRIQQKPTKLNKQFTLEQAQLIVNKEEQKVILAHLKAYDNNGAVAFNTKTIKKHPILYKKTPLTAVFCFETIYTIRKEINSDLKIEKVIDAKIREILYDRLAAFNNDRKKAFSDLKTNPIWLNKTKGIAIKRVTITGVSNAEPLHTKKDHLGNEVLNSKGEKQGVDFVSTGNNHHVAIFRDEKGKLQEKTISFFEVVTRANKGIPIIDKAFNKELGWEFLFTMKQNEMFVFPSENFNPTSIDLKDPKKASIISAHLFRVQKIATKDYFFRHHLETTVETNKTLKNVTWKREGLSGLEGIVKVRINHVGDIVQVGEY